MTKDIIKEALEDVKRIKVLAEENAKKTVKTIAQKHAEKLFTESFDMESEFEDDELMSEEELDDVINELDMDDDMEDTQSADEFVDDELGMGSEFGSLDEDELDDALADFSDESLDEETTPETDVAFKNNDIKIVEVGSDKYDIIKLSNNKRIGTYDIAKNRIIKIVIYELNVNVALAVRAGIKAFAISKGKDKNYIDKTIVDGGIKRNMASDQYKNDEMTFDEYTKYERLMEEEDMDDDLDSALMEFDDMEDMEDMGGSDEELDSALMEFDDMEDDLSEKVYCEEDELDGALAELSEAGIEGQGMVDKSGLFKITDMGSGKYSLNIKNDKGYTAFCSFDSKQNALMGRGNNDAQSIMPDIEGGVPQNKYFVSLTKMFMNAGFDIDETKVYKFEGVQDGTKLMDIEDNFKTDELDEAMDMYDEDELDNAIEETKGIGFGNRSHQSQEGNGGIKGSDSYGSKNRGMNEAVVKKLKDALRGKISREKKLEEAIGIYKEQLEKLSVLNTNMAHVTTIFLENASTKDEKIAIAKRFDKVSDVKQSKKLYEAISLELQGKKTPTKNTVNNKVRGMVIESKANINESKNEDPSFRLMRNMGMFD